MSQIVQQGCNFFLTRAIVRIDPPKSNFASNLPPCSCSWSVKHSWTSNYQTFDSSHLIKHFPPPSEQMEESQVIRAHSNPRVHLNRAHLSRDQLNRDQLNWVQLWQQTQDVPTPTSRKASLVCAAHCAAPGWTHPSSPGCWTSSRPTLATESFVCR